MSNNNRELFTNEKYLIEKVRKLVNVEIVINLLNQKMINFTRDNIKAFVYIIETDNVIQNKYEIINFILNQDFSLIHEIITNNFIENLIINGRIEKFKKKY